MLSIARLDSQDAQALAVTTEAMHQASMERAKAEISTLQDTIDVERNRVAMAEEESALLRKVQFAV